MKRVHVKIIGDVQNVGFRSWTKNKADRIGVSGWVRNTEDGNVEAVFESDEKKIREILVECGRGPPGSYVEDIKVEEQTSTGKLDGFEIKI